MTLKPGELLLVDRRASVQFAEPIWFRLIRHVPRPTYEGWAWLDGYQLNGVGDAIERREIFVQLAGLRVLSEAGQQKTRNVGPAAFSPRPAPVSPSTPSSQTRS